MSSTNSTSTSSSTTDLALVGSPAPFLTRSATVRRASAPKRVQTTPQPSEDLNSPPVPSTQERGYRRSLDSTYRLSLESISEYKTKSSFSSVSLFPTTSRDCSSIDSSSSDYGGTVSDPAIRSTTPYAQGGGNNTFMSPNSSYLSWIESTVHLGSEAGQTPSVDGTTHHKVGEWNNFWLNYSSRSRYNTTSPYMSTSNEDRTGDEMSEVRSTSSTQRGDLNNTSGDKSSTEQVLLTNEEASEAIRCLQRVVDILEGAAKRTCSVDQRDESYYSNQVTCNSSQQASKKSSIQVEDLTSLPDMGGPMRERSHSYAMVDSQDLQRQKQLLRPATNQNTTTGSSCINAILSTSVGDILKRVMAKRRDAFSPATSMASTMNQDGGEGGEPVHRPQSRASFSSFSTK